MPRRSVEILGNKINYLKKDLTNYVPTEGNPNMLSAIVPKNLDQLLGTTQNMPAIKIIMNFHDNWWDPGHVEEFRSNSQMRGVSCTDMPLRQALYFGTAADNFLLASYNDMITTDFWNVLQKNFDRLIFTPTKMDVKAKTSDKKKALKEFCEKYKKKRP